MRLKLYGNTVTTNTTKLVAAYFRSIYQVKMTAVKSHLILGFPHLTFNRVPLSRNRNTNDF